MRPVTVRVRLPSLPFDAFTSCLSSEVTVVVSADGSIVVREMTGSEGIQPIEDPLFLREVIAAMRTEILRLEEKLSWQASTRTSTGNATQSRTGQQSRKRRLTCV